jgi:flagellar motor switch protein FliN
MNTPNQELARAIVDQLVSTISALTGVEATAMAAAPATITGYVAVIGPEDARQAWQVAFDTAGAAGLTRLIVGSQPDGAQESIREALSELCVQAAGAITLLPVAGGATWRLHELRDHARPGLQTDMAFAVRMAALASPLAIGLGAPPAASENAAAADLVAAPEAQRDQLDRILDIELPVIVRFGRSELPLKTLSRLGPGSLIDLGRSPDDPVDLLVSNRVVARGEVVVVAGNYGIRILDVIDPRDRVHSLES